MELHGKVGLSQMMHNFTEKVTAAKLYFLKIRLVPHYHQWQM